MNTVLRVRSKSWLSIKPSSRLSKFSQGLKAAGLDPDGYVFSQESLVQQAAPDLQAILAIPDNKLQVE